MLSYTLTRCPRHVLLFNTDYYHQQCGTCLSSDLLIRPGKSLRQILCVNTLSGHDLACTHTQTHTHTHTPIECMHARTHTHTNRQECKQGWPYFVSVTL